MSMWRSFLVGVGSLLDLAGHTTVPRRPHWMDPNLSPEEQDLLALQSDWDKIYPISSMETPQAPEDDKPT